MHLEEKKMESLAIDSTSEEIEEGLSITALPPKIQRFVHMYSTGQYTLNKLAQLFEVHPNTIRLWLKRDDVKEILADMQNSTHDIVQIQLKALTMKAVDKLGNLVDSPIDGVALQATKDILDRGGHKPKQEIKIDKTVRTYEQQLKDIIDLTLEDVKEVDE